MIKARKIKREEKEGRERREKEEGAGLLGGWGGKKEFAMVGIPSVLDPGENIRARWTHTSDRRHRHGAPVAPLSVLQLGANWY